jgi:hypothetical protein
MNLTALFNRWDERLERWSDRLNPIVVREVRQSVKTRLFLAAFLLLLGTTWFLSTAMIVSNASRMQYFELGPDFCGWYVIGLLFCLVFVAPFGAYFSMVQEFRDRAFEVLAISTLTPNRIIVGKLQGALVMMLIYGSAIAPYFCLSYLLGGLSLVDLAVTLLVVSLLAVGMSLFAVMLGSLAQKPWIEVLNLLILFVSAWIASTIANAVVDGLLRLSVSLESLGFGLVCFAVFIFFVAILSFAVAQSQLTTTYLPLGYRRNPGLATEMSFVSGPLTGNLHTSGIDSGEKL